MKRSVDTRWNTVAKASGCALAFKAALFLLFDMPQHKHRNAKMRKYILTEIEWVILDQLYEILEVSAVLLLVQVTKLTIQ